MPTTTAASAYRARIDEDPEGVDPGDWLPENAEHYERVGPFYDHEGGPLTWEEWSARYDADPAHYVSLVLSIERRCPACGRWNGAGALGGLDYLDTDPYPEPGVYDLDDLPDDPRQMADELIAEDMHERRRLAGPATGDVETSEADIAGTLEVFRTDSGWRVLWAGEVFGPWEEEAVAIDALPLIVRAVSGE